MITVYVWAASDGYGHASMLVDGGSPGSRIYISWWPQDDGRDLNWFPPGGSGMTNYNAPAIRNRTFDQDMVGERDRDSDPPRPPTFRGTINGLDETAIKRWWAARVLAMPRWDATDNNCSTTVALALKAGGADRYTGALDVWYTHQFIWTPANVETYVQIIQQGLSRANLLEPRTGVIGAAENWLGIE